MRTASKGAPLIGGGRLLPGLLLLLSVATAYAQVGRLGLSIAPGVTRITPDHIIQGASATLLLQGNGLQAGMQVDLGAGVHAGNLSMINDTTARVPVRVSPQAVLGRRKMTLIAAGVRHAQKVVITIDAKDPASGPNRTTSPSKGIALTDQMDQARPTTAKLRLLQVTPDKLQTGQSYTLQLRGMGFAAGLSADFGAGIQLRGPLVVQNATTASARIRVATSAVPGYRDLSITLTSAPGNTGMVALPDATQEAKVVHGLEILGQTKGIVLQQTLPTAPTPSGGGFTAPLASAGGFAAPPPLTVQTSQISPPVVPAAPPVIQSVSPDTVVAGKTAKLSLNGLNLNGKLKIDFGPGVQPQGKILLSNPTTAQVTVAVAAGAPPLLRKLKIVSPLTGLGTPQPATLKVKGLSVTLKLPSVKPKPQLIAIHPIEWSPGKIELQTPNWKTKSANQNKKAKPNQEPTPFDVKNPILWELEDIPTLNDQTLFTWQEQNPGIAEWYEIRFFIGKKQVESVRIDPVPSGSGGKVLIPAYRPKGVIIAELMAALPATKAQGEQAMAVAFENKQKGGVDLQAALAKAQITWEVAGFRTYLSDGVIKSAALDTRVMLAANQVGGFVPPAGGGKQETAVVASSVPVPKTVEVEISERWPLFAPKHPTGLGCDPERGTIQVNNQSNGQEGMLVTINHTGDIFELSGTLNLAKSPYAAQITDTAQKTATVWNFDNLFIDWGDGTVVPLHYKQAGNTAGYNQNETTLVLEKSGVKYQHSYDEIGTYVVRVYQLSEDDVQSTQQGQSIAYSFDQPETLYNVALGGSNGKKPQEQLAFSKPIADRAYMLACQHKTIDPRKDPLSDGPLHLVSVDIKGFPYGTEEPEPPNYSQISPIKKIDAELAQAGKGSSAPVKSAPAIANTEAYGIQTNGVPSFTACDLVVTAGAKVRYYGSKGKVSMRWLLDGAPIGEKIETFPPSHSRSDKELASNPDGKPIVDTSTTRTSPHLPLDKIGQRKVRVEAEVIPEFKNPGLYTDIGVALGVGGGKPDIYVAKGFAQGLKSGKLPKLGVLAPYSTPPAGVPLVQYLNEPVIQVAQRAEPIRLAMTDSGGASLVLNEVLTGLAGDALPKKGPPSYVISEPKPFKVLGYDNTQPCTFRFPVEGGEFIVAGLQDGSGVPKVTHQGDHFSGSGKLLVNLHSTTGIVTPSVPIDFKQWKVDSDAVTVLQGDIDLVPKMDTVDAPGVNFLLTHLKGKAGEHLDATLDTHLLNKNLRDTNNQVPAWKQRTAVLSPQGDWYSEGVPFPELSVYDSGTRIKANQAVIDLSSDLGTGNPVCQGDQDQGWLGVRLGSEAKLTVYDFEAVGEPLAEVGNWGIDTKGLCGKSTFGSYDKPWYHGFYHWDSVDLLAQGGTFKANYNNFRVKVPWLDTTFSSPSAQTLNAGEGIATGGIKLALTGKVKPLEHGPITLTVGPVPLFTYNEVGPVVETDVRFDFMGEDKSFANAVMVNDLMFHLNGKAYFDKAGGSQSVNIGGKNGHIAAGVVNHKTVTVSALAGPTGRLAFDFDSVLKISDSLPTAPVTISYRIDEPSVNLYQGSGPVTGPFKLTKPFPDAHPTTVMEITPKYAGPAEQVTAADPPPPLSWITPAYAANSGIRFYGDSDSFMFGAGSPVKGKFLLGYVGDDDYWLAKASLDLGYPGMPLVSPFLNLSEVSGGLGYNVSLDSFKNVDLTYAIPQIDGVLEYNAGMLVNSPDGFAYALRGELTVRLSGKNKGSRMDYQAWLVNPDSNHKGKGDFSGYFQYANGAFDGTLNGKYSMLAEQVYVESNDDAIALHFGDDKWFINAGTKQNPITGHVLIIDANAYLSIGSDGLNVGANSHKKLVAGNCSGACAYVEGNAAINAEITPQPHIAASAEQGFSAGACAWVGCLGGGVTTSMKAAALPPYLRYGFGFSACPIGKIDVSLKILPNPSPGVSAEGCDLGDVF